MIVDDDQMNIEVISALLEERKVKSDSALNGKEAIKMVQSRIEKVYFGQASMYGVILLDYSMPEMDGPQVALEIRRIFDASILLDQRHLPYICCCTAYAEASFKRQALAAGMDNFLNKPISAAELDEILALNLAKI